MNYCEALAATLNILFFQYKPCHMILKDVCIFFTSKIIISVIRTTFTLIGIEVGYIVEF